MDGYYKFLALVTIMLLAVGIVALPGKIASAQQDNLTGLYGQSISYEASLAKIDRIESHPRLYLYYYGKAQGLSDKELATLDYIMLKESTYCTDLDNAISTASGCMQILYGTWLESSKYPWADRYDSNKNIETAITIYLNQGFQPWASSL